MKTLLLTSCSNLTILSIFIYLKDDSRCLGVSDPGFNDYNEMRNHNFKPFLACSSRDLTTAISLFI